MRGPPARAPPRRRRPGSTRTRIADEAAEALLAEAAERLGRPARTEARRGRVEHEVIAALRGRRPARARARRRARAPGPKSLGPRDALRGRPRDLRACCSYRKPAHGRRRLAGRTLFITGGSRGIGLAIALRAARDGANVALLAKTAEPHPKLPGTIYTAAEEIEAAGGTALPIVGDVRDADSVAGAVEQAAERFGGIDILVNNASAISLTPIEQTEPKRYDLMQSINVRGTFLAIARLHPAPQALRQRPHPHALAADQPRPRAGSARTPPTRSRSTA